MVDWIDGDGETELSPEDCFYRASVEMASANQRGISETAWKVNVTQAQVYATLALAGFVRDAAQDARIVAFSSD